ncbi:MAG: hypothetical protein ABWY00_18580 [Dongiaceae bacterium]
MPTTSRTAVAPVSPGIVLSGTATAPLELTPYVLSNKAAPSAPLPRAAATTPAITQLAIGSQPKPVQVALAEQPLIEGPTPAAPAPAVTAPAIPTAAMPAAGTAIHLASYLDVAAAQRGWEILAASHADLAGLTPLYVPVDLPGKGHFLRLYATGANPATLGDLCRRLQASGAYCAVSTGR